MTTGERIKKYREAKGITQDELANYIGVRKQTIWKYENGTITNVPLDRIEQMASILGVRPADITGWLPDSAPTRASVAAKLEGFLRQAGYLNEDEPLTPELLSSISVALETAIEIYRKNHK